MEQVHGERRINGSQSSGEEEEEFLAYNAGDCLQLWVRSGGLGVGGARASIFQMRYEVRLRETMNTERAVARKERGGLD